MTAIKRYGLIGKSLEHTFSPNYFKQKFKKEGVLNANYETFPLGTIEEFPQLLKENSIAGLNVTIPYKREVIPYLDTIKGAANEIQAVNCIAFEEGKLVGYNTDVLGFEHSLLPLIKECHTKALILGTGGAAQAVSFVLNKQGIPFTFVSRQSNSNYLSYELAEKDLEMYKLIINTTPLGTAPNTMQCPLSSLEGVGKEHLIFDLIYNPNETSLLKKAKARGAQIKNGLEMLEIQAAESWTIWNKL